MRHYASRPPTPFQIGSDEAMAAAVEIDLVSDGEEDGGAATPARGADRMVVDLRSTSCARDHRAKRMAAPCSPIALHLGARDSERGVKRPMPRAAEDEDHVLSSDDEQIFSLQLQPRVQGKALRRSASVNVSAQVGGSPARTADESLGARSCLRRSRTIESLSPVAPRPAARRKACARPAAASPDRALPSAEPPAAQPPAAQPPLPDAKEAMARAGPAAGMVRVLSTAQRSALERAEAGKHKRNRKLEERVGLQVAGGKHASKELVVVMERSLCQSEVGQAMCGYLLAEDMDWEEIDASMPGIVWFEQRRFLPAPNHIDPNAVLVNPGTKEPIVDDADPRSVLSNALLIFWEAEDFATQLSRGDAGLEVLRQGVQRAVGEWQRAAVAKRKSKFTKATPKPIILLRGIGEAITKRQKQARKEQQQGATATVPGGNQCTPAGLGLAIAWLQVAAACDCRVLPASAEETKDLFVYYCRAVRGALHYVPPCALDVLAQHKKVMSTRGLQAIGGGDDTGAARDQPRAMTRAEVSRTWICQLCCLDSLSETSASRIVAEYPTPASLMEVYLNDDVPVAEKENLLARIIGGGERCLRAASKAVYRLMTTLDPDEVVLRGGKGANPNPS